MHCLQLNFDSLGEAAMNAWRAPWLRVGHAIDWDIHKVGYVLVALRADLVADVV